MSYNGIKSSSFPGWFFNLTNLVTLDLSGNDFKDSFPSEFSNLKSLKNLYLSEIGLKGQIPKVSGNFCKLKALSLSKNKFDGGIEEFWRSLSNCPSNTLESLDLFFCKLESQLPVFLGMSKSLQNLNLRGNSLWGSIPDSIGNLLSLRTLDLTYNHMNGSIPQSIGQLYELRSLSLSGNSWEGIMTETHFINLTRLQNFRVGTIDRPMSFLFRVGNIDRLMSLIFDVASDSVPPFKFHTIEILNCQSIDLSSNNLQGEIPKEISSLILLGTLNLSMNQLTGKNPSKVGNLHRLETLDLSHNHLSGQIPQSLSSLTSLSHLDLSYNNLSERIPSRNQLQTLNVPSIYTGNPWLCGLPLSTKCPGDDTFTSKDAKDKNEEGNDKLWFYVSMVLGFIVGSWGVCGTLILKTSWRYAYFQLLDDIKDKLRPQVREGHVILVDCLFLHSSGQWFRSSGDSDRSITTSVPLSKKKTIVRVSDFLAVEEDPADAEPKFNPFTGSGRRLDGKPLKYEPAPASSSGSKDKKPVVTNGNAQPSTGSSSQATSGQAQGKLVFGANTTTKGPNSVTSCVGLILYSGEKEICDTH
ncbi:receptor-like protein EIX1 [Pyrus x bretschneideri]|uniref:receptor-like protein EIX1 n=1 Tax=Pyrus x bretschneideri TaxID=225117 RepID=UPI00202DCDEA|nr:receptor-like protein EIX1 [Pyrus x bretschneideri]